MKRRWLWRAAGLLAFGVAASSSARSAPEDVRRVLERELTLTRAAVDTHRDLATLDRARASIAYTMQVLDHASEETMRRLDAYRERREPREARVQARARALHKLARGGVARLVFEELRTPGTAAQRLSRGRMMRAVIQADLEELTDYKRAESRALAELVAAGREQQSLGALRMIQSMQEQALVSLQQQIDPDLRAVHARRQKLAVHRSTALIPHRDLLVSLHENWQELQSTRRLGGTTRWVRPIRGRVIAPFGEGEDPLYRIPVVRNGVELQARKNEPVFAIADGRVALVGELPGYAHVVVLDHGDGQYSLTGRLWATEVAEGQEIRAGQRLGKVAPKAIDDGLGQSVYFELRHGEKPIDPAPYLRRAQPT